MKSAIKSFIICLIAFAIFIGWNDLKDEKRLTSFLISEQTETKKKLAIAKEEITELKKERKEDNIFIKILSEHDRDNYRRDGNNCYDQSKEIVKKLAEENIASSIAVNTERDHAWVMVWIEATTGEFIPARNNFNILEVRDSQLRVTCHR